MWQVFGKGSPSKSKMTVLQRTGPMSSASSLSSSGTPPSGGDHDLLATASSALRRLHFKSTGGSRGNKKHQPPQQPVPKVVIMGSSTTSTSSNNTINTSTDSANTVATLITVTDGDTDTDTDRKPINYVNDIIRTSFSLEKDDEFLSGSSIDSNPVPPPPTPLLGAVSKEQHFIFVRTELDDEEHLGNFEDETRKISLLRSSIHNNKNIKDGIPTTTISKSPRSSRHRHHRQKPDVRTKNSSKINGHPPPPDLQYDFFSETFPQPSFNSTGQGRAFEDIIRQHSNMPDATTADKARGDTNIATGSVVLASTSSSSTTTVLLKKAGVLQGTVIPAVGGGVLDQTATSSGVTSSVVAGTSINIPSSPPKVNTTTNPLGIAGATALPTRQTAATTIVVQQPSLSGGSPTIATVLLKNCGTGGSGGAGVSGVCVGQTGESSGASAVSKQQREENMKQLLDVANTLTLQELHDFEMR